MKNTLLLATAAVAAISCGNPRQGRDQESKMKHIQVDSSVFSGIVDGKQVSLYFLKNKNGLEMAVTNYGAKVVALAVPDKNGSFADIVLGFDSLDDYLHTTEKYFGAVIGRYGNRIAGGKFTLNGKEYKLVTNNGPNHLHGGNKGFESRVWDVLDAGPQRLELHYLSPDGEEGYPGNLDVNMVYELTDENEFRITYEARTDDTTILNLTNHSFFNLHGAGNGTVNDHILQINASRFTPVDSNLIPTGELASVQGTPLDFLQPTVIGSRLDADSEQLRFGNGYDHNYVLDRGEGTDSLMLAGTVLEPQSGRYMEVFTTEPGMQFYEGNFLDGSVKGKGGKTYDFRTALCLETQHFPDSPNKDNFPSVVLNPGDTYRQTTVYKFGVKE